MNFHELLKNNSLFWSRLGFENDPPRFGEDGKLIEFGGDYRKFAESHRKMELAGVKIHTSILFSGWVGEDQYDYTLTDRTLKELFDSVPDALYLPRVKLNAPIEWQKKHPEELFVYEDGCNDPEVIRPLVGTKEQDMLGYEAPNGYYMGRGTGPNVGGKFSNQSFASERWKQDASKALNALMEHLEQSPFGDRIIGYHIAYGVSGETCLWGRFGRTYGDHSRVFQNAFLAWGERKYGSREKLLEAWRTLDMPMKSERVQVYDSVEAFSRKRPCDRKVRDLDEFMSELNSQTAERFCRVVKKRNPALLTGLFYGYILQCSNSAYTGWLEFDRILNSPYIDFLAAPTSYTRRQAGESGGFIVPAQSVLRKKYWVDELDIRTCLAKDAGNWYIPEQCTEAVLYREFAKNLSVGGGYWWMDLGGGWFDSDPIRSIIRDLEAKAAKLRSMPRSSTADILIVVDERSFLLHTETPELFQMQLDFQREMALAGCQMDLYRISDLKEMDLSQYKLIVFCDCPEIPAETAALPAFQLYLYLDSPPGIRIVPTHHRFAPGMVRFRGILSGETELADLPLPGVVPEGEDLRVHAVLADGTPAFVSKERYFYSVLPILKWRQFRELTDYCGCRSYGEAPCTVYGDSRFTAVFGHDRPEEYAFRWNETGTGNCVQCTAEADCLTREK